jgi:death on curing protein
MTSKVQIPSVEHIVEVHDRVLAMTGGASGVRSIDAIAGAWGRAEARRFYEPDMSATAAAATLAVSIAKAHGFVDGNKRAAYGALAMTLSLNGEKLHAGPDETVVMIIDAAAGDGSIDELAAWLDENAGPDPVYQKLFDYDLAGPEPD